MKKSAGILVYKKEDNTIKVLLCHMGGPYWQDKNEGAWGIPKGLYEKEKVIDAAIREFKEETSFEVKKDCLTYLCSKKVSSHKLVHIFITEESFDTSKSYSNTFTLEWPKGSGIEKEFPEMDKAEYFSLEEARELIIKEQVFFINRLESFLNK